MKLNTNIYEVIRNLLNKRGEDCKTISYVDLTDCASELLPPEEIALLPNLIVWDPIKRYKVDLFCPHCHQDHNIRNIVRTSSWCNRGKHTPRMLWDRGWWCALVGRFYICNKGHNIVAYHFGFLKQLPYQMVPFLLTHAAGMTTSCFDLAIKLLEQGNSFTVIQTILEGMFIDTYERKRYLCVPTVLPELDDCLVTAPTDQAIRHHFLMQFESNKDIYQSQMDRIPFTQLHVVTNGDRFNVNIGVKEKINTGPKYTYKWNKLFDNMFLIFNEFGCIKAYGLTKDICIDQIIQCLVALAPFNPETEVISMSNYCCVSRESLTEAFPTASVIFDLDYAKDLLKEQIECPDEKHEIYKDLDNTFKTNLLTPSANQLQVVSHLNNFYTKWSKDEESESILKDSFLEVLENILLHVRNGCVPLKGQELPREKTKKIFDQLAKVFQPLFLGVQTACGLIAHLVYVYNCQKLGHQNNQPIWAHKDISHIEFKDFPKGVESEQVLTTEVIHSTESVEISSSAQSEVAMNQEEFDATIEENMQADVEIENLETQPSQDVVSNQFTDKTKQFLSLGRLFFNIRESVFRLPISHYHKTMQKFVSLMAEVWFGHDYFKICSLYTVVYRDQLFAMKILGMKEIVKPNLPIRPSLMYSIYLIIKEYHSNTKLSQKVFGWSSQAEFRNHVAEKGIVFGASEDITENLEKLNKLLSREMIGQDEAHYNNLLIESKKKVSKNLNLNMKHMKAEVDFAIIFAASNVFGVCFMISPSCLEVPILPVVPISKVWISEPCFLLFDSRKGAYSAYVKDSSEKDILPCLCGHKFRKKNNTGIKHCLFVSCSCFSSGRSCTALCKCCKCANNKPVLTVEEDTVRQLLEPTPKKKRARDYNFHKNVPIPLNSVSMAAIDLNPIEIDTNVTASQPSAPEAISPQTMHHAFLDAFMYTLLKAGKMLRSEDLPNILHNMFVEVRNEVVVEPMSREDQFLQYLSEIDPQFIATWLQENKTQRKGMRDFKTLGLKVSSSKSQETMQAVSSKSSSQSQVDAEASSGNSSPTDSNIPESQSNEHVASNEVSIGQLDEHVASNEVSIVVVDGDSQQTDATEIVQFELVYDENAGDCDSSENLREEIVDDSPTKIALNNTDALEGLNNTESLEGLNNSESLEDLDNSDSLEGLDNSDSLENLNNTDTVGVESSPSKVIPTRKSKRKRK